MKLHEVLKLDKPYTRQKFLDEGHSEYTDPKNKERLFTIESALADDWIVEEKSINLTFKEIEQALKNSYVMSDFDRKRVSAIMKKILGFEE